MKEYYKFTDVMVDLETMGTRPDSPILAIGAVAFDSRGIHSPRDFHQPFYMTISLIDSVKDGSVIDPAAVLFWMKQEDNARREIYEEDLKERDVHGDLPECASQAGSMGYLLNSFSHFISRNTVGRKNVEVWGNGADFDNIILSEAYHRNGSLLPWGYKNSRCYRTIKNLRKDIKLQREGTLHNAYYDALSQAVHLHAILTSD